MTTNMWLLILFIGEFITGCVGYSLGRSNRSNKIKLLESRYCTTEYDPRFTNHCYKLGNNCIHGFCRTHCIQIECNCKVVSKIEQEILEEVKQITRG